MKIKILSYNIHKGFSATNTSYVLDQIKNGLHQTGADLLFLQEVMGESEKEKSQFEFLADGVWDHFAYGKNAVYVKGHHGNAILSKFPIESWSNINISTNRWESRGLLHAKICVGQHKLHALSLHLNLLEGGRKRQADLIAEYLLQNTDPKDSLLLAGDFNDWRKSISSVLRDQLGLHEVHKVINGDYARTFPNVFPILSLDRVYFRGLKALNSKVLKGALWKKLSDHLAIEAEFELMKD